jgi:uncharacterized iron-regulated membrane protein
MRNFICFTGLGVALVAGTSIAHAQTIETVIPPQPAAVVTAPAAVRPVETVETVRTVQSTSMPRRQVVNRDHVTTTRTTVTRRVIPAPVTPAIAAITEPTYSEVVQVPPRLYDVVTPAPAAAFDPVSAAATQTVLPTYRYVYEPDRILVIDPYTNIAVQAIPR